MATKWKALGNDLETTYGSGGHCQNIPYEDIIKCLDNGTGRLIKKSS